MTRFILAIFAILSGIGLILSLFSSIATRHDGLTQAVLSIAFCITALIFVISIGLFALLGQSQRQNERIEIALKDIALSNSDSAKALKAMQAAMEAPALARRAEEETAAAEEKKTRLAAYRAELQGGRPLNRLEAEAAMLENPGPKAV